MSLTTPNIAFVPIADGPVPQRSVQDHTHERFHHQGCSGILELSLENLGYLLVAAGRTEDGSAVGDLKTFVKDQGLPVIPGSTLKGAFRSLFEAVTHSCLKLLSPRYGSKHEVLSEPSKFEPLRSTRSLVGCQDLGRLCPACLMFGTLSRDQTWRGRVRIGDATLLGNDPHFKRGMAMPKQEAPRPKPRPGSERYTDYYPGRRMAGRKFYRRGTGHGKLAPVQRQGGRGPQAAEPLMPGHHFRFRVDYQNLREEELGALLAVLLLPRGWCHGIGAAKNHGWGNCRIEATRLQELDPQRRYRGQSEPPALEGADLAQSVDTLITKAWSMRMLDPQAFKALETILKPELNKGKV